MSYSSYPGLLSSLDDFYMTGSTKMSMVQTTNSFMVPFTPDANTVLAWQRVRMAMAGADNGKEWCQILGFHHSGTCEHCTAMQCTYCVPPVREMPPLAPVSRAPLPPPLPCPPIHSLRHAQTLTPTR